MRSRPRRFFSSLPLAFALALVATQARASSYEFRLVQDGEPLHVALPAAESGGFFRNRSKARAALQAREAIEQQAWSTLLPLSRALRAKPANVTVLTATHDWALATGAVVSNNGIDLSDELGRDALDTTFRRFRGTSRTAEQVALWVRVEVEPTTQELIVLLALRSRAYDDGFEDADLALVWRSAPPPGADPAARVRHWADAEAAPFHAELRAAVDELLGLFVAARRGVAPAAGTERGHFATFRSPLGVVRGDAERLLARSVAPKAEPDYYSAPRAGWSSEP